MNALTPFPFGYERSCIRRNLPGSFFGISAMGEQINDGNGGWVKGPAIRPLDSSVLTCESTASAFAKILGWFRAMIWFTGPLKPMLKPFSKPFIRSSLLPFS